MKAAEVMKATDFKAHCLEVLDEVSRNRREFVVTKRGKPVAKVCPVDTDSEQVYGCMKGTALAKDDLFSTHEKWDAEEFLNQCCVKAGLMENMWQSKETKVFKFQGQIFKEAKPI